MAKKVLLAPLDPVHDIGLKILKRGLDESGYETILMAPDTPAEEIVQLAAHESVDAMLISRTLGYGVADLLRNFMNLVKEAGLRKKVRIAVGGMAVRPEMALELGFDGGYGPGTTVEETIAFLENKPFVKDLRGDPKQLRDISAGYDYAYRDERIGKLLDTIADQILSYTSGKTSPAVERAAIREELFDMDACRAGERQPVFEAAYVPLCADIVKEYYLHGTLHPKTRALTKKDEEELSVYVRRAEEHMRLKKLQRTLDKPVIFNQYGTGCPIMDIAHCKVSEAWGADGVVHFDPSWGARTEGFFGGFNTHQEDGTVITPENLDHIRKALEPSTIWQVRAHRGLNTPETVVLAGKTGANMTKINICYGSLGGGTDPDRLCVDAVAAMKYAREYGLPFDVVTNEELCGVPAYKAFSGMLIVAAVARRLGCRPVLQPLFCFSPEVMVSGQMADNYVDFNAAKIMALRSIINAPIWPGAPIGFLTQTEDRVQSSATTAMHAALATMLGVDAISIASSDEAYSGGPISVPSKVDTLRSVAEGFRFFGHSKLEISGDAKNWSADIVAKIEETLKTVADRGDFVQSLYEGTLGSKEDGAYPGRNGRGTVTEISK